MTWFDGVVLAIVAVIIFVEMRQEAGKALLDTVATLAAAHFSQLLAAPATLMLGWRPLPGTETNPVAQAMCFLGLWVVGLGLSWLVHRYTRWTMDNFDGVFGLAFALVISATLGHVLSDVVTEQAVLKHGHVPQYLSRSCFADELRNFRSYHYVINTFHGHQNGE